MPPHLKWSSETKLILIREIRKRPVLWQKDFPAGARWVEKTEAWHGVARVMRKPVADCQKAWISCRTMYRKLKRKIRASQAGGVPVELSWYGYEYLKFLDQEYKMDEVSASNNDGAQSDHSDHVVEPSAPIQHGPQIVNVKQEVVAAPVPVAHCLNEGNAVLDGTTRINHYSHHAGQEAAATLTQQPGERCPLEDGESFGAYSGWHTADASMDLGYPATSTQKVDDEPAPSDERPFHAFGRYVAEELISMPRRAAILLQQQLHQCIIDAKLHALPPYSGE